MMKNNQTGLKLSEEIKNLKDLLQQEDDLEIAVLIGSRSTERYLPDSDWDIAILWKKDLELMSKLAKTEKIRKKISHQVFNDKTKIDLIDISAAGLAMRGEIAENGILLVGDNTLPWSHFLKRVWRELEEFYWDDIYAT